MRRGEPGKWAEFKRRYFKELHSGEGTVKLRLTALT